MGQGRFPFLQPVQGAGGRPQAPRCSAAGGRPSGAPCPGFARAACGRIHPPAPTLPKGKSTLPPRSTNPGGRAGAGRAAWRQRRGTLSLFTACAGRRRPAAGPPLLRSGGAPLRGALPGLRPGGLRPYPSPCTNSLKGQKPAPTSCINPHPVSSASTSSKWVGVTPSSAKNSSSSSPARRLPVTQGSRRSWSPRKCRPSTQHSRP